MRQRLVKTINSIRKEKYFQANRFRPGKQYAFVGVGMHSLGNLYPLLHFFGVDLRYIVTRNSEWPAMKDFFPSARLTHDLTEVIADPSIAGIFISAASDQHADLLRQLLPEGKKIFIEKPPCTSSRELDELIGLSRSSVCLVGLQRRYWPGLAVVKKKLSRTSTYHYQFRFGPLATGDVYTDLFIHGLDFLCQLFGEAEPVSCSVTGEGKQITALLHTRHRSGISGIAELSTQYSWIHPADRLSVNTQSEELLIEYPLRIAGIKKPGRVLGLPSERLLGNAPGSRDYFSAGNLIVPAMENNSYVLKGFYDEIKTFIQLVESNGESRQNDLLSLRPVYSLIDALRQQAANHS